MDGDRKIVYVDGMKVSQSNDLVRMAQRVIEGRDENGNMQHWGALELKIVRLLIAQIRPDDTEIYTYSCPVQDMARLLGVSDTTVYQEARTVIRRLMTRIIEITGDSDKLGNLEYDSFHWLSRSGYKNGVFRLRLSEELKPFIIGLQEYFTNYDLEGILTLPTANAIRLYELLASWGNSTVRPRKGVYIVNGWRIDRDEVAFTIEYLREFFCCTDKYPNTGDFIRRVIDPAAIAVQNVASLPLQTWRLGKEGRTISHVVFKLSWEGPRTRRASRKKET